MQEVHAHDIQNRYVRSKWIIFRNVKRKVMKFLLEKRSLFDGISMDKLTASIVDLIAKKSGRSRIEAWTPGNRLKILLVGYNGKRNTGADVRVAAIVEQLYHILGKENIEIGILTMNVKASEVYVQPPTQLLTMNPIFFRSVQKACSSYHMAVISEGSTLQSNLANSLTLLFVEACGIMKKQNKPCIAYGSETGDMDDFVYKIAQKLCSQTYFIARTEKSLKTIQDMGLEGELGTDTAWIFPPAPKEWAFRELEKGGWDGRKRIVGVAVINPFWWPVKPSLTRWIKSKITRRDNKRHYDKWYFFNSSRQQEQLFSSYLSGIAKAVDKFSEAHDVQVVLFGMEALDYEAVTLLRSMLKTKAQIFSSIHYDGYQITALLRTLSMLVTSRYHAKVLSMPEGVPSIAVSMDERLYNLCKECGHVEDYYFEVDDTELDIKLIEAMEKMWENSAKIREETLHMIPSYLKRLAGMGATFCNFIRDNYPTFILRPEQRDWRGYLPSLYPELNKLLTE